MDPTQRAGAADAPLAIRWKLRMCEGFHSRRGGGNLFIISASLKKSCVSSYFTLRFAQTTTKKARRFCLRDAFRSRAFRGKGRVCLCVVLTVLGRSSKADVDVLSSYWEWVIAIDVGKMSCFYTYGLFQCSVERKNLLIQSEWLYEYCGWYASILSYAPWSFTLNRFENDS